MKTPKARAARRANRWRTFEPTFELLEDRFLPATGLFLQGVVYDQNNNPLAGATVQLFAASDTLHTNPLGTVVTNSTGTFEFSSANATGLVAGSSYQIVDTPPAGLQPNGDSILTEVDTAFQVNNHTIQVTLAPAQPQISVGFFGSLVGTEGQSVTVSFSEGGNPILQNATGYAGLYPVTANGQSFNALCIDLFHDLTFNSTNTFTVTPQSTSQATNGNNTGIGTTTPFNVGAIAYLFNTYSTAGLNASQLASLQLAVWKLEYDNSNLENFATGNFTDTADSGLVGSASQQFTAVWFVDQALKAPQNEQVEFLSVTPPSFTGPSQGMLAEMSFNFLNTTTLATPSINTQQQPASATVGSSIADKATVSGGNNPTGTVTFNLYNNPNGTGTPLFTDANEPLVNGMATSKGYTATATGTDYWVATYNGDSNNNAVTSGTALEPVTITPATPAINTQQQPATATVGSSIADKATVSGGFNPTGTVTFNLYNNPNGTGTPLFTDANEPLVNGMATSKGYTATATGTDYWVATYNGDSNNNAVTSGTASEPVVITPATPAINTQQQPASATVGSSIADKATVSGGDNPTGTVTFNLYNNPNGTGTPLFTDANEPLVNGMATSKGYTATATGTDYWVATYNGDSNNAKVTSGTALEPVTITPATPAINTQQQPATATVGSSIADKATVSGGFNPTGTVTFNLYNNPNGTGTPLFTDANEPLVNGMATSKGYTATATGTDYWVATYNGDSNNAKVTSGTALEPVVITPAAPAINTQQQPASATVGSSIADKATVSGGDNPTGTVTFNLYSNPNGTGTPLFTDANEPLVNGVATSKGYTATATGTDYWVATYNGDSNNAKVSSGTADEPVTITAGTPLSAGATATIGYWHNKNGQALINSFNGGSSSTLLGNWLASNFPNLFGSFAGQTNAQIAADFLTAFGNVGGVQGNTYAQTFAVALAVYATDPTLGGGSASAGQGFTVQPGGTGSDTFNVGSNGAAFGVANNTSLTVLQILQILNTNYDPKTGLFFGGSQDNTNAANNVTNGINQGGDLHQFAATAPAAQLPAVNTLGAVNSGLYRVTVDNLPSGAAGIAVLARVDDAIASLSSQLGSLGVVLVEVPAADAGPSDVHIQFAVSSVPGDFATGGLGVTVGEDITLNSTVDYYMGANPSGIASGEYDFQTLVTHELAHAVGLGEGVDPASVMYPYLGTGQVRRDLTAVDFVTIDAFAGIAPSPSASGSPAAAADSLDARPGSTLVTPLGTADQAGAQAGLSTTIATASGDLIEVLSLTASSLDLPANAASAATQVLSSERLGDLGILVARANGVSAILLDSSTAILQLPPLTNGSLLADVPAPGASDLLLSGVGVDTLFGGDGYNLLVGGFASTDAATTASQEGLATPQQEPATRAALDTLMASGWSIQERWQSPTAMADSDVDVGSLPVSDTYFLDGGNGDRGNAGGVGE
jgi:hypothetical protein